MYYLVKSNKLNQVSSSKVESFKTIPFSIVERGKDKVNKDVDFANLHGINKHYRSLLLAVDHLIDMKVDVINISLGFYEEYPFFEKVFKEFVRKGLANKIIIVVAAGNNGPNLNSLQRLARLPNVLSVGATDRNFNLLENSSRGNGKSLFPNCVSYGIPSKADIDRVRDIGVNINSSIKGTSLAAPLVSKIVGGVKKMTQILGVLFTSIINGSGRGTNISLPIIGIPDTGGEFIREFHPNYVLKKIDNNDMIFHVTPTFFEMYWIKLLTQYMKKLNKRIYIVFNFAILICLLKEFAKEALVGLILI